MIDESLALQARLRQLGEAAEEALSSALAAAGLPASAARWAAAILAGIDRALHAEIHRRMLAGADPDEVRAEIRAMAQDAFAAAGRALP